MPATHRKVSSVPDDGNPDTISSGEWNADHDSPAWTIPLLDDASAAFVVTNAPAAISEVATPRSRTIYDLTYCKRARVVANQVVAGHTTFRLGVEYNLDLTGANVLGWTPLDGANGPNVLCAVANTVQRGSDVVIAPAARADVLLRLVGANGNGAADPSFWAVHLQVW